MKRIRIGKDIEIKWSVTTNGERRPLLGRDLRLVMHHTYLGDMPLPFNISESDAEMIVAHFRGVEHRSTGKYRLTLWENFGKDGQTAVDCCDAFELVATTCEETDHAPGDLDISTVNLGTANLQTGMPGKDGLSAYELFKKYNPDSKLTEEEYAETPVQAAGVALAMVEQLEETDAAVKQAEQLREQAEQGREASERTRATAEQERVAAEQQRTLAEQTRVTNESARQTAEAGRLTAETKREENTAEAIRNSEEATRKAEDEAARVRALANNPPKIVEVDGVKYWAFWDEETEQYVVSENRADVGDAVLFSPQTLTPQQQEQVRKNISPGGYMRALYESAGAVYNEETGFYELYASEGGLTDITEDEMKIIYAAYNGENEHDYFRKFESKSKIRTNFKIGIKNGTAKFQSCFSRCVGIEVACFYSCAAETFIGTFYMCKNLRKVIGSVDIQSQSNYSSDLFKGCTNLEDVLLIGINTDISLSDSPKITYNSLAYWVERAVGRKSITITVHPTTYSYLTGTAEPTEQVGGTTEEWQALVTAAQEKQISFVSA